MSASRPRHWTTIGAAALGGLVGGGVAAVALGMARWNRATRRAISRLHVLAAAQDGEAPPAFVPAQLAELPAPVARYFEFALTPGQPFVRRARIDWAGEFFTGGKWHPFTATQEYAVHPPGFVWDASIRIAPFVAVRVRDAYVGGEAEMRGRVAGLVRVVDQHGTPELAAGALLRYLAEAAWLPTALLPAEGVSWTGIDERTARASLTDGSTTASLEVEFGERGEIVRVSALRHRDAGGRLALTPWIGHYRDYQRINGMMLPTGGEVEWILPEGPQAYWRGRAVGIT